MKNRICILFFTSLISCLLLCACTNKEDVDNRSAFDAAKENFKSQAEEYGEEAEVESDCPIRIISKYGDDLTVEVTKEFYESIAEVSDYPVKKLTFSDENYKRLFDVEIKYGAADYDGDPYPADCRIYLGDSSDASKNIYSDPGYTESDGIIHFNFGIEIPGVTISGAENHPFPEDIASKTAYYTIDNDGELMSAKGVCQIKDKYSKEELAALESGKAEIEELVFRDENDRKYLSPDTDDYRIIYQELPEVTVFPGWGIQLLVRTLYFGGISNGTKNERVKAWCVDVTSYDEFGNFVSQKQKFWVEDEKDAMTLMYTEKLCAYFFEAETGVNAVPDDFDADATVRYSTDTILSRDVNEFTPGLSFIKRIGNSFYGQVDTGGYESSLVANHVAFASVDIAHDDLAADYADESGMVKKSIGYTFEVDGDPDETGMFIRSVEHSFADCTVWYSKPDAHRKSFIRGNKEHFNDKFPEDVYNDGFVEELQDNQYFTPKTDDYFLYYIVEEDSPEHNNQSLLISFDENGAPVDICMRFYRKTVNPLQEIMAQYDYLGGTVLYSDNENLCYLQIPANTADRPESPYEEGWEDDNKLNRMDDFVVGSGGIFFPYRGFMDTCHAYVNVPEMSQDALIAKDMIEFDSQEVLGNTPIPSDDYIVIAKESNFYGDGAPEKFYCLYFFDEEGRIIDNGKVVYIFATEEQAQTAYDQIGSDQSGNTAAYLNGRFIIDNITETDPILWSTKERLLTDYIKQEGFYDEVWFSIPYLTEGQYDKLDQ